MRTLPGTTSPTALQARALVSDVLDCYRHIDILVNNAGITRDRSVRKMTDEDWAEVIETNLNSVFYCTSAALPAMIDQKYGRIVNIASFSGQAGNFGQANYAASKGGIIAMTKVLALELAKYNITANVIAPGFTETDMLAAVPADVLEQIKQCIPMQRLRDPEEIAKAVAFLDLRRRLHHRPADQRKRRHLHVRIAMGLLDSGAGNRPRAPDALSIGTGGQPLLRCGARWCGVRCCRP